MSIELLSAERVDFHRRFLARAHRLQLRLFEICDDVRCPRNELHDRLSDHHVRTGMHCQLGCESVGRRRNFRVRQCELRRLKRSLLCLHFRVRDLRLRFCGRHLRGDRRALHFLPLRLFDIRLGRLFLILRLTQARARLRHVGLRGVVRRACGVDLCA